MLTETMIQDALLNLIENMIDAQELGEADECAEAMAEIADEFAELFDGRERVTTFRDAGLLTRDKGIVLRMGDGSEFQITIVQR